MVDGCSDETINDAFSTGETDKNNKTSSTKLGKIFKMIPKTVSKDELSKIITTSNEVVLLSDNENDSDLEISRRQSLKAQYGMDDNSDYGDEEEDEFLEYRKHIRHKGSVASSSDFNNDYELNQDQDSDYEDEEYDRFERSNSNTSNNSNNSIHSNTSNSSIKSLNASKITKYISSHIDLPDSTVSELTKVIKSDDVIGNVFESITDVTDSLKGLQNELKFIQKKFMMLKKDYTKVISIKNKLEEKKNKQKLKLQSGFVKPRHLSNEMTDFLEVPRGTMLGRNEVTSRINQYIVKNDLRDAEDRRVILPNPELRKLLNVDESENITYFNLQKFMKGHFINK